MTRWFLKPAEAIYATYLCHAIAIEVKTHAVTSFAFGLENQRGCKFTVGSDPTLSVSEAQSLTGFFNA